MKVQGPLMQARFIESHQVFKKKNKAGYFSNSDIIVLKQTVISCETRHGIHNCWVIMSAR